MNKIQILLFYFERPKFVLNALKSIKAQKYKKWELHFIDDGSVKSKGKEIVQKIFSHEELNKTYFYDTEDSIEQKLKQGGSIFGKVANEAMQSTDAEITLMLCDDDALYDDYLENLNEYFLNNPEVKYAYSHVCVFDPFTEKIEEVKIRNWFLNNHTTPIHPVNKVDASQVAWRRKISLENNILFPFPQTISLDAVVYEKLYNSFGPCPYTGFVSQYKAVHKDQLGNKVSKGQIAHHTTYEGED